MEKPSKPSQPNATEGISSTIASLFESRHPWTKEGGLESGFGFSGFGSGGLLGIRGSMPRLPSFKVQEIPSPTPTRTSPFLQRIEETKVVQQLRKCVWLFFFFFENLLTGGL